jgi:hypothetical protein
MVFQEIIALSIVFMAFAYTLYSISKFFVPPKISKANSSCSRSCSNCKLVISMKTRGGIVG